MTTFDDIRVLVAAGESETVEFKTSTAEADRAGQTIAGMANQAGGVVIFGIRPDGTIVGQQTTERTQEKISAQLRRVRPGPIHSVKIVSLDDEVALIVVSVDAGPLRPYRWNGRAYLRTGAVTNELTEEQAQHLLLDAQHQGRRWEDEPSSLTIDELDEAEIRTTVSEAIRVGRIMNPDTEDLLSLLRGLNVLTEDDRPTNAAAVLFGTEASLGQKLLQCQLKVVRFLGVHNTDVMDDEHQWIGNIFDLYWRADRFLLDHLRIAAVVPKDSWVRVDTPEIPPNAMREAVLNALAHRDYSMWQGSTSIAYFDDRVEIASPGPLHFGLTPAILYAPHRSEPWNPRIARVLHQRGLIETWGTGFNRMVTEVRAAGLVVPLLSELPGHLVVTFTRPGFVPVAFKEGLSPEQIEALELLFRRPGLRMGEIVEALGRPRRSVARDLASLAELGRARVIGETVNARWEAVNEP